MNVSRRGESEDEDPEKDQLLEDLGRVARARRARGEQEVPRHRPLDSDRFDALLDVLCGPETISGPGAASSEATEVELPRLGRGRRPLQHEGETRRRSRVLGYLVTALATAAAVLLVLQLAPERLDSFEHPASVDPVGPGPGPAFGSWRIDGGGPPVPHQGEPDGAHVCSTRELLLVLAVDPDATIDRSQSLQLVLLATSDQGDRHHYFYDIDEDDRIAWAPDDRALIVRGTLHTLAPLPPGAWALEPRVGPPGTCTTRDGEPGCTFLEAQAIEVDGAPCDGAP